MPKEQEASIRLVFKGEEQMKIYNLLRDRAWKRESNGMSEDIRSVLYTHFFKSKKICATISNSSKMPMKPKKS